MANKVISIEIGSEITRVIEADFKSKNPKIDKSFAFPTPNGMTVEEHFEGWEDFHARLEEGFEQKKIKTRKVIFSVASSRIASRDVVIPQVKANRILPLLHMNSAEYFPVDLEQYQLCYRIVGEVTEGEETKHKLMVLAVPNDLVTAYGELAQKCGLQLETLDYVGNATTQIMCALVDKPLYTAVKLEEDSTMVSVIKEGKVILQRHFSYGIEDAVMVVQKSHIFGDNLSFLDTLRIMREQDCICPTEDESNLLEWQSDVQEAFRAIEGNISRVMNFYTSNNDGEEIEEVVIYGLGADIRGIRKLLSEHLEVNITSRELTETICKEKQEDNRHPLEYMTCLGATIDPIRIQGAKTEEDGKKRGKGRKNQEKKEKKSFSFYAPKIMELCIVVAVIFLLLVVPEFVYLKVQNAKMEKEARSQQYLKEEYDAYLAAKEEYDSWDTVYDETDTTSNKMGAFITEMEQKMPNTIQIESITSDSEKIVMEVMVATKREAAKVISVLQEFESITSVEISELSSWEDETGQNGVRFSIDAIYKGGSSDEETNTETTVDEDVEMLSDGEAEQ